MNYVTYAPDGTLTGSYCQALHADHAPAHIEVTEAQRLDWTIYRANAARTGLEVAPPVTPPVVVPEVVPMLNAKLAMIEADWMGDVTAYLDAIPGKDGELARTFFAEALTMRRDHPLVLGIPSAIGKTEAEVDALFIVAGAMAV